MTPLSIKITRISSSLIGVTAVGGGIFYLTPSKDSKATKKDKPILTQTKEISISSLLEGKRLLTKTDTDKWTEPWNNFKKEYTDKVPPSPWKFTGWPANKEQPDTLEAFKTQCISLGAEKVEGKGNATFIAVNTYCTTQNSG